MMNKPNLMAQKPGDPFFLAEANQGVNFQLDHQ
jgi:hypothetical protein